MSGLIGQNSGARVTNPLAIVKVSVLLLTMWGVTTALSRYPNIGFVTGLFIGSILAYFVKPRRPSLRMVLLADCILSFIYLVVIYFVDTRPK